MMRRGRVVGVALATLAVASPAAFAQSAGVSAEALFEQGRELMKQGRVAEACAAFDASQKVEPATTTLLNLANCREKNGQLATAWGHFVEAARQTRNQTGQASQQLNQIATERSQRLRPRVSQLTIAVADDRRVNHLEVLRDGVLVDSVTWNRALPIDGGTYKIMARAPGLVAWTTEIIVANESDAKTVEIPALQPPAAQPPATQPPVAQPPAAQPPAAQPPAAQLPATQQSPAHTPDSHEPAASPHVTSARLGVVFDVAVADGGEGGALAPGIMLRVADRFDITAKALVSTLKGGYVGASWHLLRGRWRPAISMGIPVFASQGARIGVRSAVAFSAELTSHISIAAELGGEFFLNPEMDRRRLAFVPVVGVRVLR